MRRKATSIPESKIEVSDETLSAAKDFAFSEGRLLIKKCLEHCGVEELPPGPSPLDTPQHRRALREAARLELKQWEERWLRQGADPESMADSCEGARVRLMSEARARGRQG